MAKKEHTLSDLLLLKMKALYDIEQQLIKALPKMAASATDKELKKGFKEHLTETKAQAKRLEQAFKLLGKKATKTKVEAIRGLIDDATWVMKNVNGSAALDAALIAAAQHVEHYEMAGYITAVAWAQEIGEAEIAQLLYQSLEEEIAADEKLGGLAESRIDERANA